MPEEAARGATSSSEDEGPDRRNHRRQPNQRAKPHSLVPKPPPGGLLVSLSDASTQTEDHVLTNTGQGGSATRNAVMTVSFDGTPEEAPTSAKETVGGHF